MDKEKKILEFMREQRVYADESKRNGGYFGCAKSTI